ncbi:MAG: hypothetical protein A2762_03765 [Candidatus Lloydbacteria bacterium RIFCSPHIGHO2_01_FULL_54_11]|nr:MAG: hypothetical protein A2762_03765 [Candidatus Lloydbacteria bacterium RIFCSPHIGHO2_01_FULL_54_11]
MPESVIEERRDVPLASVSEAPATTVDTTSVVDASLPNCAGSSKMTGPTSPLASPTTLAAGSVFASSSSPSETPSWSESALLGSVP